MSLSLFEPFAGDPKTNNANSRFASFTLPSILFVALYAIAIGFALYSDHRWEDWYITYRASKNMALGHGLVFNVGERIHSFTSPIGTLLPALYAYLTSNNDEAVIWLFRLTCAIPFALAGVQLLRIAQSLRFSLPATIVMLGLFGTNMLMVDFTINGMETAFMMLFLAYFVRILVSRPEKILSKLVFVMAALMYTRPDSFIYAGTIGLGFFFFNPAITDSVQTRKQFVVLMLKAAGIAALVYLPWVIAVWMYYGSPIPHTIIAKSGSRQYDLNLLRTFLRYPFILVTPIQVNYAFLPPYAGWEWHPVASKISHLVSCLAFFAFIYAFKNKTAQAISLGAFLSSFYLNSVSGQNATPWYLPNLGLMIIFVVALLIQSVSCIPFFKRHVWPIIGLVSILLLNSVFVLAHGACEMKMQQQIIEFGERKQIGLYLHEHAKPDDKIFMECLGYIGFYSGLKTYDYPGMSSPEVVASIKKFGPGAPYAFVINDLKPDWVILRGFEVAKANQDMPTLLSEQYVLRKEYNVRDQIPKGMLGYEYLDYDASFSVFERKR